MSLLIKGSAANPQILLGALSFDATPCAPLAGAVNDFDPPNRAGSSGIALSASAAFTINGIAGGTPNQLLLLINQSAFTGTIAANAGGSAAVNQFASAASVAAGASLLLVYSGSLSKWCPVGASAAASTGVQSVNSGTSITVDNTDPANPIVNFTGAAAPVGANPSALVGLTAVNGVATTFLRSDGAPALDQGIVPTWTARHTFSLSGDGAAAAVALSSANPAVSWNATGQAADAKLWGAEVSNLVWVLRTFTDAGGTPKAAMAVTRAANAIGSINFGNATDNNTTTFLGTGTLTVNGKIVAGFAGSNGTNAGIDIDSSAPVLGMRISGGAADGRVWDTALGNTTYNMRAVNDANSAVRNWLSVSRTSNSINITGLAFGDVTGNPAFTFLGTGLASFGGQVSALRFVPTASAVPTNGFYLPAANTIGFSTNTVDRFDIDSAGTWLLAGLSGTAGNVLTSAGPGAPPTWAASSSATGANPTATVGLAAVNGVATTFLRSDGAPALDQSIVPTWTGSHTFSAAGSTSGTETLRVVSTNPIVFLQNTSAAADLGKWRVVPTSGALSFAAIDDAYVVTREFLRAGRGAGVNVATLAFGNATDNTTYTFLGTSSPKHGSAAFLLQTSVALTNGAAGAVGTLSNAPAAGNPTKWIPVNDNGTTRYIPAW